MIKESVKIYDFDKIENNMANKKDIKGMASKEDLQDLKKFIKDIKHNFVSQLSTQGEDKEEQDDLFQSRLEKIEKTIGE